MSITADEFRLALSQFGSGVTAVTTRDRTGAPLGLTVSAFCSVSLDPPLVLVSIDDRSETNEGFRDSGLFAVSVLSEDQEGVSRRFALSGPEKFAELETEGGALGLVLVAGAVTHIECRVVASYPAGDHTLYLGEVLALRSRPGRPLLYHSGAYRRLAPEETPA